MTPPPPDIIQAFGLQGTPRPISGGRGLCYAVDQTVFKPSDDDAEAQWVSELATSLLQRSPKAYRLATPLSTPDQPGRFVFNGWTAASLVSGKMGPAGHFDEIFRTSRELHADLADLVRERPAVVGKALNRFNEADRVTWGEKTLDEVANVNAEILARFQPLLDRLARETHPLPLSDGLPVPDQLVHADLTGNVLFDESEGTPPGIIDLTFYWRPALYAEAVVVADGLAWSGESGELVKMYGTDELRLQLLVRAMYWRCLTFAIDPDLPWVKGNLPRADYEKAVGIVCGFLES